MPWSIVGKLMKMHVRHLECPPRVNSAHKGRAWKQWHFEPTVSNWMFLLCFLDIIAMLSSACNVLTVRSTHHTLSGYLTFRSLQFVHKHDVPHVRLYDNKRNFVGDNWLLL
ncbi:hypothetical protein M3J09_003737 [Ascochyta lentis]